MRYRTLRSALFAVATVCPSAPLAIAEPTLIGRASFPGDATDKSGLTDMILEGVPHNRLGSFGSAIDYSGSGDLYIAADDRGPADGQAAFFPRLQTLRITIRPGDAKPVAAELVATTLLTDESGTRFSGASAAFNAADQARGSRLDPEGLRVSPAATRFICDEYGPWIDEFDASGKRLHHWAPPPRFMIEKPDVDAHAELAQAKGRQANRGFEGLALKPDGVTLLAILQSPLIQDGGLEHDAAGNTRRTGVNNRILELNTATGKTREFVYVMDNPRNGVNEILTVDDYTVIVLERDGNKGKDAASKALYLVDLANASDVSAIDALPSAGLPAGVAPVRKQRLLDLLDARFGIAGPDVPEKVEGLCFGPRLPDGRRTLIVTSDNDFKPDAPSWIWVFACEDADLRFPSPPAAHTPVAGQ